MRWGSSVSVVTRLQVGRPWSRGSIQNVRAALRSTAIRAFYARQTGPGRVADRSPPSSAEFKKVWSFASTVPYAFMGYTYIAFHLAPLPSFLQSGQPDG